MPKSHVNYDFPEKKPSVPYRGATTVPYRGGFFGPYNGEPLYPIEPILALRVQFYVPRKIASQFGPVLDEYLSLCIYQGWVQPHLIALEHFLHLNEGHNRLMCQTSAV